MNEFMRELKENGGKLKYDLSSASHREMFFSNYGGEERFRQECPLLYEALQRRSETPVQEIKDGYLVGPEEEMEVSDISCDASIVSTKASGWYTKKMTAVDLMGTFQDITTGQVLSSMAVYDDDISEICDTMKIDASKLLTAENRELQTQAEFFYVYPDAEGRLCAESTKVFSDVLKIEGKKYIVKKTEVIDPAPSVQGHEYTVLLYDRDPDSGETADYPQYKDVRMDYKGSVYIKIHIPAKIHIVLDDPFEFIIDEDDPIKGIYFKNFEMKIWNMDNGTVVFNKYDNASKIKVTYDPDKKNEITYEFPSDWNHIMPIKVVSVRMNLKFSCTLPLKCRHGGIEYKEGQIVVVASTELSSQTEDPANAVVKPIQIKMGCLGKDTRIRMADHSEKLIQHCQIGDRILTKNGTAAIVDVLKGDEREVVYVETVNGRKLMMTEDHPILVRRDGKIQYVRAGRLRGDDILQTEDQEEPLRYMYMKTYNDLVYSIVTDGNDCIIANGIYVGDFTAQNSPIQEEQIEDDKSDDTKYSFDKKQVEKEMRRLLELYTETCKRR